MFPLLPVTYVRNEVYETTNYIYSMYLAKKYIEDDLLLLHGDIVLEEKVLKDIINSRQENLAIVDSTVPLPEKDFKCRIENEVIREIGIHLKKDNNEVLFLLPVYKLSLYFMTHWMKEIENFVHNKNTSVYAENAFNVISNNLNLLPFDIKGDFCMEVDTTIDLETAKKRLG